MTWVFTLKNDIRFSYSCKPKEWKGKRPKKWDLVKLDNQGVEKEYVVIDVILDNEPGMKFKRNFVLEIYDKDKHKRVTEHFQY